MSGISRNVDCLQGSNVWIKEYYVVAKRIFGWIRLAIGFDG